MTTLPQPTATPTRPLDGLVGLVHELRTIGQVDLADLISEAVRDVDLCELSEALAAVQTGYYSASAASLAAYLLGALAGLPDDASAADLPFIAAPEEYEDWNQGRVLGLADEFTKVIREWLTPAELVEVDARNAGRRDAAGNVRSCATHDFIDANEAMDTAYRAYWNRDDLEVDFANEDVLEEVNAAWILASTRGFSNPRERDLVDAKKVSLQDEATALEGEAKLREQRIDVLRNLVNFLNEMGEGAGLYFSDLPPSEQPPGAFWGDSVQQHLDALSNELEGELELFRAANALRRECEGCGVIVDEDDYHGRDKPDGSTEYLCCDCYVDRYDEFPAEATPPTWTTSFKWSAGYSERAVAVDDRFEKAETVSKRLAVEVVSSSGDRSYLLPNLERIKPKPGDYASAGGSPDWAFCFATPEAAWFAVADAIKEADTPGWRERRGDAYVDSLVERLRASTVLIRYFETKAGGAK